MRFLFRLLAVSVLIMWAVACEEPKTDECASKDDCLGSQVCCKAASSDEKGTCKAEADCATPACTGTPCKDKSDCSAKETCTDGCCKEDSSSGKACQKNLDCASGQECVPSGDAKKCLPCSLTCTSATDCAGGGETCENGCCRLPSCTKDDDCANRGSDIRCKTDTGECVECLENKDCEGTGKPSICRSEVCVTVECVGDSDCLDNNKPNCNTTTYKCAERPVCVKDADCFADPQLNRCDPTADSGKGSCKKGNCVPCSTDDECGGSNDFCVGTDKGLKDGRRCLRACDDATDCPDGFICSDAVIKNFKICFPPAGFCEDPCLNITCQPDETCSAGKCKPKPAPCNACTSDDLSTCEKGADCLTYPNGTFCGRSCNDTSDCPTDAEKNYTCLNGQCLAQEGCKK